MNKALLIVGTALITSAIWLAVTATTGLSTRSSQRIDAAPNDPVFFSPTHVVCTEFRNDSGLVKTKAGIVKPTGFYWNMTCENAGHHHAFDREVQFTLNKIKVWSYDWRRV